MLRAGVVKALRLNGALTFDRVGPQVFDALELRPMTFCWSLWTVGPVTIRAKGPWWTSWSTWCWKT